MLMLNIIILNLTETNNNSKYLIGHLDDEVIEPLVLILDKMSGYVKRLKAKDGNKDNKLMSFHIDDEKLFEI